jgi:alpha-L-fucosidase
LKRKPYPNGQRDHSKYIDYLHGQVSELMSGYGTVDVLWFDFSAVDFQGQQAWRADDLMELARGKNPNVIINNRLYRKDPKENEKLIVGTLGDFSTPEQKIPENGLPGRDWETCMTLNTTWGYSAHDQAWKSDDTLIRNLVDIASKGGNYLLNIGPKADGSVPEASVKSMRAIGAWLKVNGDAIYATGPCPLTGISWGRCTMKAAAAGTTLYLHVFDWPQDGKLVVPGLKGKVSSATLLASRKKLATSADPAGVIVKLPVPPPDRISSTVVLKLNGPLTDAKP